MFLESLFEQFSHYFLSPSHRLFLPYMVVALGLGGLLMWTLKKRPFRLSLFTHPSARLDYRYFGVIFLIKVMIIMPLLMPASEVAIGVARLLDGLFGYQPLVFGYRFEIALGYTLTLFIVSDFTRYWLHRFMHTVPWLWRIHRVHHTASRLTPFTFYRIHPLESLLFGIRYALSAGVVTGVFIYFFKAHVNLIDIAGANVAIVLFNLLGSNLRHSHIPLRYPRALERIFISPRQHQIHHARDYALCHSNYGGALALWDWCFRTLRYSDTCGAFRYGVRTTQNHDSIMSLLTSPFRKEPL